MWMPRKCHFLCQAFDIGVTADLFITTKCVSDCHNRAQNAQASWENLELFFTGDTFSLFPKSWGYDGDDFLRDTM